MLPGSLIGALSSDRRAVLAVNPSMTPVLGNVGILLFALDPDSDLCRQISH